MNATMHHQAVLPLKAFATKLALEVPDVRVYRGLVVLQVSVLSEILLTGATLVGLLSTVNTKVHL